MRVTKSPIVPSDDSFLLSLYSETRANELLLVPWSEEQKNAFLQHQFQSQHLHYTLKYKDASFQLIKLEDLPIGRFYHAELADEIRIIDILILSEFRGRNIGSILIEEILHTAEKKKKAVRIYLDINDKSANLFTRLGFAPVSDEGVYRLWQWSAKSRTETAKA
jgi:GNAT superfamily N-acetyltransferase